MLRRIRVRVPAVALASVALLSLPSPASAADPGRWRLVTASTISYRYWQGLSSDLVPRLFFTGFRQGLYRTDAQLAEQAGTDDVIPADVHQREGYNHIGDPSWDAAGGGRVLLPMECYDDRLGNTCGTGAFGVADPDTLGWRYYVKLDPADIRKAMWVEASPDGRLAWTSSGGDLLAYRLADVRPGNASPGHAPIRPVRRLAGAVPASGVTGAAFWRGRLLLAGQQGGSFQVWSVNVRTGARRLEIERAINGESEGIDIVPALGGLLQWGVMPLSKTGPATYGQPTLLTLTPAPPPRLRVRAPLALRANRWVPVRVRVGTGRGQPIALATVRLAGSSTVTDKDGRAVLRVRLRRGFHRLTAALQGTRPGAALVLARR